MSILFSPERNRTNVGGYLTGASSTHSNGGGIQMMNILQQHSTINSPYNPRSTGTMNGSTNIMTINKDSNENQREYNTTINQQQQLEQLQYQHLYILPVLLLEFLALAITRAVLPSILLHEYGNHVYFIMGFADFVRGSLAFIACPMFGKLSDIIGRRLCLLVTVFGTCAPICSLALFSWQETSIVFTSGAESIGMGLYTNISSIVIDSNSNTDESLDIMSSSQPTTSTTMWGEWVPPYTGKDTHPFAITIFVILLGLSGVFSSTFTLVFAYISDTVKEQDERVSAYGLALATFGLSFTLGPMLGGYLAKTDQQYVFIASLLLTVLDLLYIYFILPESRPTKFTALDDESKSSLQNSISLMTMDHKFSWNPVETLRIVIVDPFLRQVGKVAFLYYTGLWALISTLSVYAVQRFHLSPERLGELISVLGLSTMIAEAALVRIIVPILGEKRAMKLGLASFCLQCLTLGFAYEGWHLFICAGFSLLGNLVYPSLTSLVSGNVEPDAVGEALGAINGIKALTEGIGPLFFGSLMTISEKSALPGWPYLLAASLVAAAYMETNKLPDIEDDDYIHELDQKKSRQASSKINKLSISTFFATKKSTQYHKSNDDEELDGLLSEIEDLDDDDDDDFDVGK
jgi:MFS family permease